MSSNEKPNQLQATILISVTIPSRQNSPQLFENAHDPSCFQQPFELPPTSHPSPEVYFS